MTDESSKTITWKKLGSLLLFIVVAIFAVLIYAELDMRTRKNAVLFSIAGQLEIIVIEGPGINRTLVADTDKWYCRIVLFEGGTNPKPHDLSSPRGMIHFYFFEDIDNKSMADNYSDLIIRLNLIKKENNDGIEELFCVLVFFGEGGYGKEVYYRDELFYTYNDTIPESNYGGALVQISVAGSNLRLIG